MKKPIAIFKKFTFVAVVAFLLTSCNKTIPYFGGINGNGNVTTETRNLSQDFNSVKVSNGIKCTVQQSDAKSITVVTDENLQKHILTIIEDGVLILKADDKYNSNESPLVIVKMPKINVLKSTSGSEINNDGIIISENIEVSSSSGSKVNLNVEADAISIESSSGSTIILKGKALKLETSSSSGSEIDAKNLMTNEVISHASSGSSTSVYAILKLEAQASSGSSIHFHKSPKIISKKENSGGSINQED